MHRSNYLKLVVGIFCMFLVTSLTGCESKESPQTGLPSEEVVQAEERTDQDVFQEDFDSLEDFDSSQFYCKDRKTVCNRYWIDEDGVLWGAGINDFGQLGVNPVNTDLEEYKEPVKITEDVCMVDASGNGYFVIYLTNHGELYGIGSNMLGLLGQPYTECYSENDYLKITEPVLLMEDVKYASAGRESIAALKKDGSVWWWGQYRSTYLTTENSNLYALAWQAEEDETNPVKMLKNTPAKLLEDCVYVTTGDFHGAAITAKGELYTWGLNLFGECGVEVGDDDYIRVPAKVLDGVKMVWVERVDTREKGIYDTSNHGLKYNFNIFVQTVDDNYLAAGKDLGDKEKAIQLTGDIYKPSTESYSDTFVPIELKEYSEEGYRVLLNTLQWGDSIEKVDQLLSENHMSHWTCDTVESVENSETDRIVKTIDVNSSNYLLEFDEKDCLYKIILQVGGSRNGFYSFGMKLETIKDLIPCDLSLDPEENAYVDIYHTTEAIDGTFYSFVFEENSGELIRVEEASDEYFKVL